MCALPFFFPSQGVCVRVCVSRPLRLVVLGKAPGLPPSPRPPFSGFSHGCCTPVSTLSPKWGDGEILVLLGFHSGWGWGGQLRRDMALNLARLGGDVVEISRG